MRWRGVAQCDTSGGRGPIGSPRRAQGGAAPPPERTRSRMSDYGTPPPPPPAPGYNAPVGGGTPPPNHLVWSILTTLFCCLPLGIVSIIFAAQVNGKWQAGD